MITPEANEELRRLKVYHDIMESSFESLLYTAERILDHFNEDGTLKGDGKWRIQEIYTLCSAFVAATHLAAERFVKEL